MTASAPDPTPAAWRLAPGLRVVRRGRDRLQVGLHPDRRVVLPDDAHTHQLLAALQHGGPPPTSSALERLRRLGMLVPVADDRPRVAVVGAGWPLDDADLLLGSGMLPAGAGPGADAVLVLCDGEPDRSVLDPLVRDGSTHLVVTLVDGGARVGPLVQPGLTACLRCVDGHLAVADPDHLAVLTRYAAAGRRAAAAGDGPGDRDDAALVALATGWAVRDLARHLRGSGTRPLTWSSTLTWHPGTDLPEVRRWQRHPDCGCGWSSYATSLPGA